MDMIDTLDIQLVGRLGEMLTARPGLPVYTSPLSQPMTGQDPIRWALDGVLTHVMYVKDGKIYVGWFDSHGFTWFFDCYSE